MCIPAIVAGLATVGTTISTALGGAAATAGAAGGASALAGLSTLATVAGGAITAYSGYQNAKAAEAAAKVNAQQADLAALDAIREGADRSDQVRRRAAAMRADQKVAMAANGIDVGSASAIELLDETTLLGEQDAFAIRESSRSVARGQDVQAANYRADASTARSEAFYRPVQTILGTASKVGRQYASYA